MWIRRSVNLTNKANSVAVLAGFVVAYAALVSTGCAARTLTITQDDRINTAVHRHRPEGERTGDPLKVTIVCVYPKDLEREENQGLKPGSGITCKDWYANQPVRGGSVGGRFKVPPEQIYVLTNESEVYGNKKWRALQGAIRDGTKQVEVSGIRFRTKLYGRNSVIYVFPKFIGPAGEVLPVPPAVFSPPGAYASRLGVKIGVEEGRGIYGQYIENTTKRTFGGSKTRRE